MSRTGGILNAVFGLPSKFGAGCFSGCAWRAGPGEREGLIGGFSPCALPAVGILPNSFSIYVPGELP